MPVTYTQLSSFVKDVIDGTSGIGVIYTEPKDFRTEQDILDNCMSGTPPHLNVWFIDRTAMRNSLERFDGRPVPIGGMGARQHTITVTGFYGYVQDKTPSTYLTFQNLISSLLDNIQGKKSKANFVDAGLVLNTQEVGVSMNVVKFMGGYEAHQARLEFNIEEMYQVTYI